MTWKVERRNGIYRIVTPTGIALDDWGNPLDGGGFRRKVPVQP